MHVRVGSHPGVAEQIPGATDVIAGFHDGECAIGAHRLQVVGGADSRDASADDGDIHMRGCRLNARAG